MNKIVALLVIAVFAAAGSAFGSYLAMSGQPAEAQTGPLNADTVDNYSANQIVRATAATADNVNVPANTGAARITGAQMKTPKNGWVMASATGLAAIGSGPWEVKYAIVKATTCPGTPPSDAYVTFVEDTPAALSISQAFKTPRGTHDFSLCLWKTDPTTGTRTVATADLVLLHVPFDFDGAKP